MAGAAAAASVEDTGAPGRKVSFGRGQLRMALAERERLKTIVGSPAHSVFDDEGDETAVGSAIEAGGAPPSPAQKLAATSSLPPHDPYPPGSEVEPYDEEQEISKPLWKRILLGVKEFALSLITPPTISLISALVCALVQKLKSVSLVSLPLLPRRKLTLILRAALCRPRGLYIPSNSARRTSSPGYHSRHCDLSR